MSSQRLVQLQSGIAELKELLEKLQSRHLHLHLACLQPQQELFTQFHMAIKKVIDRLQKESPSPSLQQSIQNCKQELQKQQLIQLEWIKYQEMLMHNLRKQKEIEQEHISKKEESLRQITLLRNQLAQANHNYNSDNLDTDTVAKLNNLGNVYELPEYYFGKSDACKDIAKFFLNHMLMDEEFNIIEKINAGLVNKRDQLNQNQVWPNCISFITTIYNETNVNANNKRICFIAVSGLSNEVTKKNVLMDALDLLAIKLNKGAASRGANNYLYAVIKENSLSFNGYLAEVLEKMRHCAEYDFGALLAKLFLAGGEHLKVEGASNCALYFYESGMTNRTHHGYNNSSKTISTTNQSSSENSSINKHNKSDSFIIRSHNKTYQVNLMPCCSRCQQNKDTFIATLIHFQEKGKAHHRQQMMANRQLQPLCLSNISELFDSTTSMSEVFHKTALSASLQSTFSIPLPPTASANTIALPIAGTSSVSSTSASLSSISSKSQRTPLATDSRSSSKRPNDDYSFEYVESIEPKYIQPLLIKEQTDSPITPPMKQTRSPLAQRQKPTQSLSPDSTLIQRKQPVKSKNETVEGKKPAENKEKNPEPNHQDAPQITAASDSRNQVSILERCYGCCPNFFSTDKFEDDEQNKNADGHPTTNSKIKDHHKIKRN
jgi:hypothetical protein